MIFSIRYLVFKYKFFIIKVSYSIRFIRLEGNFI